MPNDVSTAALGILLGSILVEAVVNVMNNAKELYKDWKYWTSIIVSVAVAVVYGLDFFDAVGLDAVIPYFGMVLTGIILSRGSNYISDILKRIVGATG
jgi:hypothetical protein